MTIRTFHVLHYVCPNGHRFDGPMGQPIGAADTDHWGDYGLLLLRSQGGETRYLNTWTDVAFDEVGAILEREGIAAEFDDARFPGALHQETYGVTVDPDARGFEFGILTDP